MTQSLKAGRAFAPQPLTGGRKALCVFVYTVRKKILKFDDFNIDEVFLTFQPQSLYIVVLFFVAFVLFCTVTKA